MRRFVLIALTAFSLDCTATHDPVDDENAAEEPFIEGDERDEGDEAVRTTEQALTPVERPVGWSAMASSRLVGSVYCWGNNSSGQVGDGARINRASPVRVAF